MGEGEDFGDFPEADVCGVGPAWQEVGDDEGEFFVAGVDDGAAVTTGEEIFGPGFVSDERAVGLFDDFVGSQDGGGDAFGPAVVGVLPTAGEVGVVPAEFPGEFGDELFRLRFFEGDGVEAKLGEFGGVDFGHAPFVAIVAE